MRDDQYIFGIHATEAAIQHSPKQILQAWVADTRHDQQFSALVQSLKKLGVSVHSASSKELDQYANDGNHQGIVLKVRLPQERDEAALKHAISNHQDVPFYLVLDQVTDPHNLGACLRSADAAGVHGVIVPKDNACRLNATVCKVASGAAERVPLYRVTNLSRTLRWMKDEGIWLVGAAGESDQALYDVDLTGSLAVVMGAEGSGLRRLTREQCDHLVKIPMPGRAESLNVSVATGVLLFEVVRQKRSLK